MGVGNVVKFERPSLRERAKGRTLCARGFHRWQIDKAKQFDVKRGQLVTTRRCTRCGTTKTTLT